jgi:Helix-turn-helix domain
MANLPGMSSDCEPSRPVYAYSAAQLAREWGVSTRCVYDLCARGDLGHIRIGGLIRIRQADREAYEARQWVAPSSKPQAISSPCEAAVITFNGGRTASPNAFQQGRQISAKRQSG